MIYLSCFLTEALFLFQPSTLTSVGGADEHPGADEAGAGFHQAASVLHPAVSPGAGLPPHQHEAGEEETAGGDPGDEVSATVTLVVS